AVGNDRERSNGRRARLDSIPGTADGRKHATDPDHKQWTQNLITINRRRQGTASNVAHSQGRQATLRGGLTMTTGAHLWAIGFDARARAHQVREEITKLAWGTGRGGKHMLLYDIAVVVRQSDGSFVFEREAFPGGANILACTAVGFLAGLAVAAP